MTDLDAAIRAKLDRQHSTMTIDGEFVGDITGDWQDALLAVLDLHKPGRPGWGCDHCDTGDVGCNVSNDWPCPTVKAIAKGLGIEA